MKTIHVNTAKSYDVIIGGNLLNDLKEYIPSKSEFQKAIVISDSNVWPLYGPFVADQMEKAGYDVLNFVFAPGEESKSADTYLRVINFLASNQITRNDVLVALGGGVVGDLTGFVAATYLRGIAYIQIPTTVLAMVDSSVGGKTAIDIPAGKNLIGAFYQPKLVLCDTQVLNSLPDEIFRDGCAEVIKYALLFDPVLFDHLKKYGTGFDRDYVISKCVEWKRDTVEKDEFDRGPRQLLNFGHTIGHAIESLSGYAVTHGQAVAIGMSWITVSAYQMNLCTKKTVDKMLDLLQSFGFSISLPCSADEVRSQILLDKKRSGNEINFILPTQIGHCEIHRIPINEIQAILEAGLSLWTSL